MARPSSADELHDELKPPTNAEACEICGNPGSQVQTERRGVVTVCTTCLGRQLRRRLPWRRYLNLAGTGLLLVPVVALLVGTAAEVAEYLRSGSAPPDSTLIETIRHGLELLTAVSDVWGSLGVITAIAIALPISLVTIASHGEQIARRAETAPVPSLDDHARLTLLDGALSFSKGIAHLTAALAFVLAIDALLDGRDGWAQQTVFCLILATILVLEIGKLDAFPKFAARSKLLVTVALVSSVAVRRALAREVSQAQAATALVIALAVHALGYLAVMFPAGPVSIGKSLVVAAVGAVGTAVLAGLAALYLRAGDRPSLTLTVFVGLLIGAFWVSAIYSAAESITGYGINPWVVVLSAWSYIPLYLLTTLGLIGAGPLRWLVRYTVHIDDAITKLDDTARAWTRSRFSPELSLWDDGMPRPIANPGALLPSDETVDQSESSQGGLSSETPRVRLDSDPSTTEHAGVAAPVPPPTD
ncbi:hypothetical protein C8K30_1011127 [Promicromonospora sp. AC04]|nr:hypothetical protein C8K30_1011127 [Promicromonospora sp. AC04]